MLSRLMHEPARVAGRLLEGKPVKGLLEDGAPLAGALL